MTNIFGLHIQPCKTTRYHEIDAHVRCGGGGGGGEKKSLNGNSFAEAYVNSTLQIRTWKWSEKKTRTISRFETGFYFFLDFQRNETLPIDPVFSSWVNLIKKPPILNCSRN